MKILDYNCKRCKDKNWLIECGCKACCHEPITIRNRFGQIKKQKIGHGNKIDLLNPHRPVKKRTSRERAKFILINIFNKTKCEVDNYLCNGRLEPHHIDKNPFNNSINNLLLLCDTHHNFADNRNLSLNELKNLKLDYYISSGKRRYKICGVKVGT